MRSNVSEMTLCSLFTALTAVGAFIQVPVPGLDYFTLQFFFVLLAGLLLGSRRGCVSVAVYVALGLCGVPVFAAGGGFGYVLRPSFGYLLGFIAAAFLTGLVREKFNIMHSGFHQALFASFCGFAVCYAVGLTYKYFIFNFYLGEAVPFWLVVLDCFPLDMPGDVLLVLLASFFTARLRPALAPFLHN